jgi:hypothetical protein
MVLSAIIPLAVTAIIGVVLFRFLNRTLRAHRFVHRCAPCGLSDMQHHRRHIRAEYADDARQLSEPHIDVEVSPRRADLAHSRRPD